MYNSKMFKIVYEQESMKLAVVCMYFRNRIIYGLCSLR